MKASKSERTKKIVQTDDKRLFYTTVNFPSEDSASQVPNKHKESLNNSPSNEQKQIQKQPSYEYKIGNYLIQQTLGEGTFGKVKLGIYLPNDEKVAIKVLEKDRMTDKDDQIRVKREFDMLSRFNHPNVILVTEIFESVDSYYSVMEYCEGGELFNYIVKKRRLTEKESSFFYFQIINGLEYIHSLGIVHRDLKPENLLLTKDHLLKIIDFGLSNYFVENQTELLSTPCGSPCYASPEMVAGKKYDGIKIDVWSTGIILFAMLCGYLPFEDKNNDILFDKILECKLEFPEFLSEESKDLISRILVVDPDKRITIPQIKQHSFFLKGKKLFDDVFTIKPVDDIPLDNPDYKEEENIDESNKKENIENVKEEINHKESKNESKINIEIKDENDLNENKENINIENFQNNDNNISSLNNNQAPINDKTNVKNNRNKNLKNYDKGFILNDNDSKKSKKDKTEEIKDNNNKQKIIKTNRKLKELNSKYFHLVEKKNNHKKINITDNNQKDDEIIIKNSKNKKIHEPNKRNKINRIPIHKTPEIKNGKIIKLKEKVNTDKNKNNLILDTMTKDRNTIGSIASIGSSVVETINNISQQTNTTNNINYNVNISFEHSKRTYSHENTKDTTQNEQSTKNYINKISNNNITAGNNHNINIIDNNNYKENKYFKKVNNNNNYLFNHFNYHNKYDKIRKNKPSKIKKNLKDPRMDKHYYNSDNIRLPREEIDFNICKLINDSIIKKNYKEFLFKKNGDNNNNNSKSKNKDNHLNTNRTNCINSNKKTNVSNNKDNNNISIDNNKSKNKNYMKKIQNNRNINPREISTKHKSSNKNKNLSTINNNNNSKSRYKKLLIKPSNLLNKTIENNNKKKVNKLQYNTLKNQNSIDEEQNPISMQTEPNKVINKLTKNNKIKNIKTTPNLENKKFSQNLKHNTQQKPFREKIDLSLKKGKIAQRWTKYNPINQLLNISNKKNFETINTNYNLYKPDINSYIVNKNLQKNIVKPKTSHSHLKKKEIPNKIIEKASKSIEIKNDKNELFNPENNKVIHIDKNINNIKGEKQNNIKPVSNYNISNNESHTNYIKINDTSHNQSNSKSKDEYIYKNKENLKANIEISLNIEHDLYQAKNKILKMNKFRNICLNNNNNETIDLKNNDFNNNKKSHIRTIRIITKLNNKRDNLFKIQKNKTVNMSNKINHIISHSTKIYNNNSYLIGENIDHHKLNSMRLADIYKNNIKNKNKLKKVYLIDKNKKYRKNSNESKRNNKSKTKGILNNPAVFQKQNTSNKKL